MKHKMSDREVWNHYTEAQKEADMWEEEFRGRGLHNKPFVQWSTIPTELLTGGSDGQNTANRAHDKRRGR